MRAYLVIIRDEIASERRSFYDTPEGGVSAKRSDCALADYGGYAVSGQCAAI